MTVTMQGLVLRTHDGAGEDRDIGPITIEIGARETVLVVGPSGSGKSLLLATLAGLRRQAVVAGTALVDRPIGVVFPRDALEQEVSVVDNVMSAGVDRVRARDVLVRLGLGDDVIDRRPQSLSGGQRRRVALARALAAAPQVLLLDDPTAGLDPATAREVLAAIATLAPDAAVLVASPDVDVVAPFAPRALWLGGPAPAVCPTASLPAPWAPRPVPRMEAA